MSEQNTIVEEQQKAYEALAHDFIDFIKAKVRTGANSYKLVNIYKQYDIDADSFDTVKLDDAKAERLALICMDLANAVLWLHCHRDEFKDTEFIEVVNGNYPKYQVKIQQAMNDEGGALYLSCWYPLIKSLSVDCMPEHITKDRVMQQAIYVNTYMLVYQAAKSLKEQKLIINGADAIQGRSSVMRFEKEALDDIIFHIWREDAMAVASLQHINEAFWQHDMFAHLQIKSIFQVLKMGELKTLSPKNDYKLPEGRYLNEMADSFIGLEKQSRTGPQSIYSVYAYVNAQRHLRELVAALETYSPLRIRLLSKLEPVEKLLSELNKIYRIDPDFVPMYSLAATLCDGQPQFALDARPYLRDAIEHASKETMPFTAEIFLQYGISEKQMYADGEKALQCFQKAQQLDDSSYKAMFQVACLDAADRKYKQAKADFKKVIVTIQGNDTAPDWSLLSLEEILYIYRTYIWFAKLALIESGEFAIGTPIAMALNAVVAFRQATMLHACCDAENYQRVGQYHGSGIVVRAMFVVLRDMVGEADVNNGLREKVEHILNALRQQI